MDSIFRRRFALSSRPRCGGSPPSCATRSSPRSPAMAATWARAWERWSWPSPCTPSCRPRETPSSGTSGTSRTPTSCLPGRLESFRSIRTYGGLSGFPCRSESPFDAYGTGHSSTSVSAAVGMVEGRLRGGDGAADSIDPVSGDAVHARPGRVVAVIGDGALTGGMAYEALNHAGHLGTPLLVVLNDNAMSIERNVGAMSTYLSRLRIDPKLYRIPSRHGETAAAPAGSGRAHGSGWRASEGQHQGRPSAGNAVRRARLHVRRRDRRPRYRSSAHEYQTVAGSERPRVASLPHRERQGLRTGRATTRSLSWNPALLGPHGREPRPGGSDHVHSGVWRGPGRVGRLPTTG